VVLNGFIAWAPELAKQNDGFPEAGFEKLIKLEANSFWFRFRNAIILWALEKYFPNLDSFIEVGCGTGFVLSGIVERFSGARMVGSEIYSAGLVYAAKRLPDVDLVQMDARKLPYCSEFDVLGAFDVIEHILEDELVLLNFQRAIKRGGGILITVPQHAWLWSPMDEVAFHKRRYSKKELHAKVEAAGFQILHSTSFVFLLLPLMMGSRLFRKFSQGSPGNDELALSPTLDSLLSAVMKIECLLIKWGISLPVGGSRFIVGRKI
jgi:SAM-dependent methyltransferase